MRNPLTDLTEEQLAAIGTVVVEFSLIEEVVDSLLYHWTKLKPEQLSVLIPRAMLGDKLDMMRDLGKMKLRSEKKKEKLVNLVAKLQHLNSQRHIAVHGVWKNQEMSMNHLIDDNVPMRGKSIAIKKKGNKNPSMLSADQLENLAKEVQLHGDKLLEFRYFTVWGLPLLGGKHSKSRSKAH